MVVIIIENSPPRLRGELSRWLFEPAPGVYIGHLTARVRDRLWERCCRDIRNGGVVQAWDTNNEQRFQMRTYGITSRQVIEIEGLQLVLQFNPPVNQETPLNVQIEPETED